MPVCPRLFVAEVLRVNCCNCAGFYERYNLVTCVKLLVMSKWNYSFVGQFVKIALLNT